MAIRKSPIEISLTDFVDFVCKSGSTKLTHVKNVKYREDYSPATDFYKALREGIIDNHKAGGDKRDLNDILLAVTDGKKVANYRTAIEGYKKFWGRKSIKWFMPVFKHWKAGDIDVRINPELGIEFNDKFYLVKLYFKGDKLSRSKIDQILTLMESQLRSKVEPEVQMAILDVKNSKLFIKDDKDLSLLPLLNGEAKSFEEIWKAI